MSKTVWASPLKFLIAHPYFGFQANKKLFSTWVYNIVYHRTMARLTYHVHIHWISYMIYSWHMQAHGPSLSSSQGCSRVFLEMQHPTSARKDTHAPNTHLRNVIFLHAVYTGLRNVTGGITKNADKTMLTLSHKPLKSTTWQNTRNHVITCLRLGMWILDFLVDALMSVSMHDDCHCCSTDIAMADGLSTDSEIPVATWIGSERHKHYKATYFRHQLHRWNEQLPKTAHVSWTLS